MQRAWQKLFKHGNTTGVVIPRQMLIRAGWLAGERIIVEEIDGGGFILRRPTEPDVQNLISSVRFGSTIVTPSR